MLCSATHARVAQLATIILNLYASSDQILLTDESFIPTDMIATAARSEQCSGNRFADQLFR
jgi:hypothetical protein